MDSHSKIQILRFFIYDSEMKCKEGEEHQKIYYYWSKDPESVDIQCRYVGLMEGVYRFGSVFSEDSLIKCLSTQKTRTVFYSPEPHLTMVMSISVPCKVVPSKKNLLEFRTENMDINIYRSVLIQSFSMYQFFHGTQHSTDTKRLSQFFSEFIPSIQLSNSSIFDLLPSIRFLTLGSSAFLKVTTLMNKVENLLTPFIHSVTFVHEEKIVWSTLQQDALTLLYDHIKNSILPKNLKDYKPDVQNPFQGHCGRYILGSKFGDKETRVHFQSEDYQLLVYGALQSLVVLTVSPMEEEVGHRLLKDLDSFLGPPLTTLSVDLCDVYGKPEEVGNPGETDMIEKRFIYYNASNRALKSTIPPNVREQPLQCKLMCDVYSDIEKITNREKNKHSFIELDIKSSNNQWVVGRKSGDRLFFVTTERNSNLIELTDSVDKIVNEEFKNICLLEK